MTAAVGSQPVQGHGRVQARGPGAAPRGGGVAAGDFVGEDDLEELGVGQIVRLRERESFREGVDELAELEPPQGRGEFGQRVAW